jgi:hypothetical protein
MSEIIAGVQIPLTSAAVEATRLIEATTTPLLFHHSRRVFLFGSLHARLLGLSLDPELLYLASLFHDAGLLTPFSDTEQRFEIDGADHAQAFLLLHRFSSTAVETVWNAIALHTTPGIPGRMGPEIAMMNRGVLTDAIGLKLDEFGTSVVDEITGVHPRGDFKNEFLATLHGGLKDRPDTTYGTVNADILEHFEPGIHRMNMVDRIRHSAWPI